MSRLTAAGTRRRGYSRTTYAVATDTTVVLPSGDTATTKTPIGAPAGPTFVWNHGLNSTRAEVLTHPALTDAIAAAGWWVIAPDCHGTKYANDQAMNDIEEAVAHTHANGALADVRVQGGNSGGGMTGLVSAAQQPAHTLGSVVHCPLVDADGWFTFNPAGLVVPAMNAAFAPSNWNAQKATHDPTLLAGAGAYTGHPIRIYYGTGLATTWDIGATTGDGIIPAFTVTDFAGLCDTCELFDLGGVNHFQLDIAAPAAHLLRFLDTLHSTNPVSFALAA